MRLQRGMERQAKDGWRGEKAMQSEILCPYKGRNIDIKRCWWRETPRCEMLVMTIVGRRHPALWPDGSARQPQGPKAPDKHFLTVVAHSPPWRSLPGVIRKRICSVLASCRHSGSHRASTRTLPGARTQQQPASQWCSLATYHWLVQIHLRWMFFTRRGRRGALLWGT